jgi:hypothetical protein
MQGARKRLPGESARLGDWLCLTCVLQAGTNEFLETSYFSCRKPPRHEPQGTNSVLMDLFSRGSFYLVRDSSWNLLALACVACGLSGPSWLSLGSGISPAFPILCKPADDDNAFFILPLPGTVVHGRIGTRGGQPPWVFASISAQAGELLACGYIRIVSLESHKNTLAKNNTIMSRVLGTLRCCAFFAFTTEQMTVSYCGSLEW